MDGLGFDDRTRYLSQTISRRAGFAGLVAGLVGLFGLVPAAPAVSAQRCLRNGTRCRRNRGANGLPCHLCCSGFTKKRRHQQGRKCTCRPRGKRCSTNSQCCTSVCEDDLCRGPLPICIPEAEACEPTDRCCNELSCAGRDGIHGRTCQDCDAPMTVAGALCGSPEGNQCCNGDPEAFVAVKAEDGSLVCLIGADCGTTCEQDSECDGPEVCITIVAGSGCCNNASRGICADLAP